MMMNAFGWSMVLLTAVTVTTVSSADTKALPPLWDPKAPHPGVEAIPAVQGVQFSLVHEQTPDFLFLHEPRLLRQDWGKVVAEIPPLPPSADETFFGANLGRTLTLLETGGQTKRPVRILFYGQSITASEWVWLLVRQLRARYPNTTIEAENWAISGWGIHRLYRTIKHDILRKRPDLVVLHAYGAGSWEWERILQTIRRETTAEVMIRSAHIDRGHLTRPGPLDSVEALLLRRLARTYGCEMVEETWTLTFTHSSTNNRQFRYTLAGSETGPDGEGDSGALFVSTSGRITIDPADFLVGNGGPERGTPADLDPMKSPVGLTWRVHPLYPDEVQGVPLERGEPAGDRHTVPYRYVTIVDSLPPGEHELTLIPAPGKSFAIEAVEVHRPPLRR